MGSSVAKAERDITKQSCVSIKFEGHGRENISGIEIDRTVGWFTNIYSIVIKSGEDIYENIIEAKETLRRASEWKLGYSYATEGLEIPKAEILFNYLGEYSKEENFEANYYAGRSSAAENTDDKVIALNGQIYEGKLYFTISSTGDKYTAEFVKELAKRFKLNLEEEAEYCTENLLANKTASDYGLKDMSISEFSKLTNQLTGEVEKIYGLTPLQEGMLFYNLEDENSTSYVFQNVIKMESEADAAVMEESLRLLSERYDVLRTAIIYHGLSEPKQVVYRERKPELNIIEAKDEEENRRIIEKDVERGFVLDKDPLFRVTILKCNGKTRLLITTHHIITDGWCINLLFTKLISYYDRLKKNPETKSEIEKEIKAERATEGEYSDYIKWIDGKSTDGASEYWNSLLNGYDNVAEIKPIEKPEASKKQMDRKVVTISRQATEKLIKYAEEHESTLNTLSEAAIGIVLQGYTGSDDVVFGKVVSGRTATIKGIDKMVG